MQTGELMNSTLIHTPHPPTPTLTYASPVILINIGFVVFAHTVFGPLTALVFLCFYCFCFRLKLWKFLLKVFTREKKTRNAVEKKEMKSRCNRENRNMDGETTLIWPTEGVEKSENYGGFTLFDAIIQWKDRRMEGQMDGWS